jgi:hypothetical protein
MSPAVTSVLLSAGVLTACVSALFAPMLIDGRRLLFDDLCTFALPLWHATQSAWRAGGPPLWVTGLAGGYPLLAEGELGPLYPPHLILIAAGVDATTALNLSLAFHLLLLGAGTYVYLRALDLGGAASILGGVTFMLCIPVQAGLELPLLATVAWIPLLFLCAERGASGSTGWIAVGGAALGGQMLAGHPQGAFLGLLAWPLFFIFRARAADVGWPTLAARLGTLLTIGFALSLPQLAGRVELLLQSTRAAGQAAPLSYSFPPRQLLTLLVPTAFGVRTPEDPDGYWGAWNYWSTGIYVGLIPLAFAIAAMCWRLRDRRVRFHAVLVGAAVVFAFGSYFAPSALLLSQPPFAYFRVPGRFLFLAAFGLSVLAAFGFDHVAESDRRRRRAGLALAVAGACLFALLGVAHHRLIADADTLLEFGRRYYATRADQMPPALRDPAAVEQRVAAIYRGLVETANPLGRRAAVPIGALAAAGAALVLVRAPAANRRVNACVAVLVAVDLLVLARNLHFWSAPLPSTPPAVIASVPADPAMRLVSVVSTPAVDCGHARAALVGNLPALYDRSFIGLISPLRPRRHAESLPMFDMRDDAAREAWVRAHVSALRAWSVGYVIAAGDLAAPGLRLRETGADTQPAVKLYAVLDPLPRAFVAGRAALARSPGEVAERWREGADPRAVVWLAAAPEEPHAVPGEAPSGGRADIVSESAGELIVRVKVPAAAWLVVNDTHYPGWRATVDGRPADLHPANGFVRAVAVDAGEHVVRMAYRPAWWWPSLAVSFTAAIAVAMILWRARRRCVS